MNNTRVIRVHVNFDDWLNRYALDLSTKSGRRISKAEASLILAQNQPSIFVIRKRKGEPDFGFGAIVNL